MKGKTLPKPCDEIIETLRLDLIAGRINRNQISEHYGVSVATTYNWIRGTAGRMSLRRQDPDGFRRDCLEVEAGLMTRLSAAKKWGCDSQTITRWGRVFTGKPIKLTEDYSMAQNMPSEWRRAMKQRAERKQFRASAEMAKRARMRSEIQQLLGAR